MAYSLLHSMEFQDFVEGLGLSQRMSEASRNCHFGHAGFSPLLMRFSFRSGSALEGMMLQGLRYMPGRGHVEVTGGKVGEGWRVMALFYGEDSKI